MQSLKSLRIGGIIMMISSFLFGAVSATIWVQSNARWASHLDQAQYTGAMLYKGLQSLDPPPAGVTITPLTAKGQQLAERGQFKAISGMPHPSMVTNFSIRTNLLDQAPSKPLVLAILSPDLRYPIANLTIKSNQTPAETMGALTRLLATYCSEPVIIAKLGGEEWLQITAPNIWGCQAAPSDHRLLAFALALLSIAIFATFILNNAAQFSDFAQTLRDRNRLGGPKSYDTNGVQELHSIVLAVNEYLAVEREKLADRVTVLSGVSHDLGTPATRLRLRTALIQDDELRTKLEADIDSMTNIIESVLTYTRAELDLEEPRQISLTSLIESIVADYQDTGRPVEFLDPTKTSTQGGRSVFMSRQGKGYLPDDDKIIITARPISLGRAVSNLIDNALKYGRNAKIHLHKNADKAIITIEDEGNDITVEDIEGLTAPYKRGHNTQRVEGYGLGLTIASTIANLHGGTLTFEPGTMGLIAKITILRR